MSTVFQLSGLLVMPIWALLILAPGWRWTERIARTPHIALPAALLYAALVLPALAQVLPLLVNPELPTIAALLGTPEGATIAWVHFLAFDLFVGRFVYLDGRARGLPWWITSPILLVVLMVGPLGFALHLGVRALTAPRVAI
ncbi:MAG: ABA4-like family protein [Myxococcota bacterium]